MRKLIIILLFTYCSEAIAQVSLPLEKSIIGTIYKKTADIKQFNDYKKEVGVLMMPINSGYCLFKISNDKNTIILFDKYLPDVQSYKILDTIKIGPIKHGEIMCLKSCRINLKEDNEIFALVKDNRKTYFKDVIVAWRANRRTNKITIVAKKDIDCLNDDLE